MTIRRARSPVVPRLPLAPGDYSKEYMDLLVQAIDAGLDNLTMPRAIRTGRIILSANFPTSATGLRTGEVYRDGNTLRVVT